MPRIVQRAYTGITFNNRSLHLFKFRRVILATVVPFFFLLRAHLIKLALAKSLRHQTKLGKFFVF